MGTGFVFLIFGRAVSVNLDISRMSASDGICISGLVISDYTQVVVSAIGDFNRDGVADIAIGPDLNSVNYRYGAIHVVFGGPSLVSFDLKSSPSVYPHWQTFDLPRWSSGRIKLSAANDVNGDGCDDFILAVPSVLVFNSSTVVSQVYIMYGAVPTTATPSAAPTRVPSLIPSHSPSVEPSLSPSLMPRSATPTNSPVIVPITAIPTRSLIHSGIISIYIYSCFLLDYLFISVSNGVNRTACGRICFVRVSVADFHHIEYHAGPARTVLGCYLLRGAAQRIHNEFRRSSNFGWDSSAICCRYHKCFDHH
jgi:hypothetical protein